MPTAKEILLERIISALESGKIPWKRPWDSHGNNPSNYVTEKAYSGMNVLLCLCADYSNPYFLTFNQIRQLGGTLKKGSKAIPLCFYKSETEEVDGKEEKRFILRYFNVFRWEDTEGIPEKTGAKNPRTISMNEAAEAVWSGYKERPVLTFGGDMACYMPSSDIIRLPPRDSFHSSEGFYSTLFHEMIHSTGHGKRLDRPELKHTSFGSEKYSREELVAEIGAAFLCAEVGIQTDETFTNTSSYIQGWIKALKNDPGAIFTAASKASKAVNFVLGKEEQFEIEDQKAAA